MSGRHAHPSATAQWLDTWVPRIVGLLVGIGVLYGILYLLMLAWLTGMGGSVD